VLSFGGLLSLAVIVGVDTEVLDVVIDDALCGLEMACGGGGDTAVSLQGVHNYLTFKGFHHGLQ
jgi:hypothetical protein